MPRRELGALVRPLVILVVRYGVVRHTLRLPRLGGRLRVVQEELERLGRERDRLELLRVCRPSSGMSVRDERNDEDAKKDALARARARVMMRSAFAPVTIMSPLTCTCCKLARVAAAPYSCDSATELTFWFQ